MIIAIDLNDVLRDYTDNFIKTYLLNYNREYNTEELSLWTNDMESVLPFKTQRAYQKFTYEDYSYEIFGKCDVCTKNLQTELNEWLYKLTDLEITEPITVMLTSTMEFGPSIGYTYFFISKLNCNIREVYLPVDSMTIWDKCDILITANPLLVQNCPEGKKVVKIETDYNSNIETKYSFKNLSKFIKDENNVLKVINDV